MVDVNPLIVLSVSMKYLLIIAPFIGTRFYKRASGRLVPFTLLETD
jgi:hypothetical protein